MFSLSSSKKKTKSVPLIFPEKLWNCVGWPGRFPRIAGNAGNHGNDRKFHESHHLTKFKETLINYAWDKIIKKQ